MRPLTENEAWVEIYHALRTMGVMPITDQCAFVCEGLCDVVMNMLDMNLISSKTEGAMLLRIQREVDRLGRGVFLAKKREVESRLKYVRTFIKETA